MGQGHFLPKVGFIGNFRPWRAQGRNLPTFRPRSEFTDIPDLGKSDLRSGRNFPRSELSVISDLGHFSRENSDLGSGRSEFTDISDLRSEFAKVTFHRKFRPCPARFRPCPGTIPTLPGQKTTLSRKKATLFPARRENSDLGARSEFAGLKVRSEGQGRHPYPPLVEPASHTLPLA